MSAVVVKGDAMALDEATVPITFAGGIDTKTDSKSVAPTHLIALENGVFDKSTTIVKRTGYDALAKDIDGGGLYETPAGLAARGDELVLFADDQLFSYRDSTGTWSRVGRCQSIVHTERPIAATGTDQSMPDGATLNGVTVLAWEDSRGGVWWAVVELVSGRMLRAAEQLNANGERPRVVACGDRLHVYYAVAAAGQIWVVVVNPSLYLTAPAPIVLVATLSSSNPSYDAQDISASSVVAGACLAWALATGGYQVAYVDPSGVLGSAVTGWPASVAWAADTITGAIAITISGGATPFFAVAWVNGLNGNLRAVQAADLSLSITTGTAVVATTSNLVRITVAAGLLLSGTNGAPRTDIWVWGEEPGLTDRDSMVHYAWTDDLPSGALTAYRATLRGHGLVSRGFLDSEGVYVLVAHEVPFFPYVAVLRTFVADVVVSTTPGHVAVGRLLVGSSDGLPVRGHLATVELDADDARVHRWPGLARQQVNAPASGLQFTETAIEYVTLDFASADAFQHAEFGRNLIVAGAMPWRYDGDTVAEMGFHTTPDGTIATATDALGGAMTSSSSYFYAFCYEEVDAAGVIHPGAMSVGTLVTLGVGDNRARFDLPTYRLTSKRRVRIGVFRSEANDTEAAANGFPDMYRVTSLDPSAITGNNRYVDNDTTVDVVGFIDGLSDLLLLTRERAYTNNGVLSNDPIGLGSVIVGGKDRLFFSDPTDGQVVRYSQAARDGYGPEISADLSIAFDQDTGAVTALGVLDDKLLVFKERGLDFIAGPGPLPNPDAAPQIGFSAPQQIPSDVGCTAPRSLATTSDKVMFQAADGRGIHEVDRSCAVSYVGAPVEAYNAIPIVSADDLPGKHCTIFLMATGKSLLYDDYHGQWSTFTNHDGIDGEVVAGRYHYLRANVADYRVFRSSTGYLDAGLSILLYLETAWIKLAGYHQGLQKIWRATLLGKWISSHVLSVAVATDYRPGFENPYYIEVDASRIESPYGGGDYGAGDYGGDDDSVFQQRIDVSRKCQAIRFAIGETMGGEFDQAPPTGGSFELTEMLLTGGVLRPAVTLGANRTQ